MPHLLPPIPYNYDALEPWIDEHTMRIHHDQHHRHVVAALNEVETRLETARAAGDVLLMPLLQQRVATLSTGHQLHGLFWNSMGPNQGGAPSGELADRIDEDFGDFATFKLRFSAAAMNLQPGGWVVLTMRGADRPLEILTAESNVLPADWATGILLVLDAWEHAYYRRYENRRAEYVHNWWNTVHWSRVAGRFAAAAPSGPSQTRAGGMRRNPHGDRETRTTLDTLVFHARRVHD